MYVFFDLILMHFSWDNVLKWTRLTHPLPLKLYSSAGIQSSLDVGMEGQLRNMRLTNFGDFYPKKHFPAKRPFELQ